MLAPQTARHAVTALQTIVAATVMWTAAIAYPLPGRAQSPQNSSDYYLVEFPTRGNIAAITCYPGSISTGTTGAEIRLKARGLVRVPRAGTIKIELLYDGPENM
ncbi:MAG: hypothetical protein JSS86_20470, partial [Cyanobacteria bacterium SZAS LIN-2]|nr:hypothetical protein [Cyanobacteria bacterium SZAS LIN-2]